MAVPVFLAKGLSKGLCCSLRTISVRTSKRLLRMGIVESFCSGFGNDFADIFHYK